MSLKPSLPEKTNLYINSINQKNKNKIEIIIPDGIVKCEDYEDFYITIISFNTLYNFYQVIDGYNNNFKITINGNVYNGIIPFGNINVSTIMDY